MSDDETIQGIVSAFESLDTEFATDRVIADPDLKESLIAAVLARLPNNSQPTIQRTTHGNSRSIQDVCINHRRLDIAVT